MPPTVPKPTTHPSTDNASAPDSNELPEAAAIAIKDGLPPPNIAIALKSNTSDKVVVGGELSAAKDGPVDPTDHNGPVGATDEAMMDDTGPSVAANGATSITSTTHPFLAINPEHLPVWLTHTGMTAYLLNASKKPAWGLLIAAFFKFESLNPTTGVSTYR